MDDDFLQQLAEIDVPEAPDDLVQGVHDRLNVRLTVAHVVEFIVSAIPSSIAVFLDGILALARFTMSGEFGDKPNRPHDP